MFLRKPPVEDPLRIEQFKAAIASLSWKPPDYRGSVEVLFNEVSVLVEAEIRYYYSRRCSSRRISKICRFLAWLAGAVGISVTLLAPIWDTGAPKSFLSWGYFAFGLAGVILLFDSLFAGTQAHHRYTATQLKLEHIYAAFCLRWERSLVDLDANSTAETVRSLMDEARALIEAVHEALATETQDWKKDVEDSLSQLKGRFSAGSDAKGCSRAV